MKETSINKYDETLREGIADKIARLLASKAAKRAIDKAKKLAPDDESMKAEMESLKQAYDRVESLLDEFCRRNPDHNDCKDKDATMNKRYRWY